MDNLEESMHAAPPALRVKFLAVTLRGGRLERVPGAEPNPWADATYAIRLDDETGPTPYRAAAWAHVELSEAERRQWAHVLLEGL